MPGDTAPRVPAPRTDRAPRHSTPASVVRLQPCMRSGRSPASRARATATRCNTMRIREIKRSRCGRRARRVEPPDIYPCHLRFPLLRARETRVSQRQQALTLDILPAFASACARPLSQFPSRENHGIEPAVAGRPYLARPRHVLVRLRREAVAASCDRPDTAVLRSAVRFRRTEPSVA